MNKFLQDVEEFLNSVELPDLTALFEEAKAVLIAIDQRIWMSISAALGLLALVLWIRALLDRPRFEAQHEFLTRLPRSRTLREQEARRLWQQWIDTRSRRLEGSIVWRVLDEETEQGRILVRPAQPPRLLTALAGLDVHARRPQGGRRRHFLMTLPPNIRSVRQAMAWLWGVPARRIRKDRMAEY
jgi:hypothetical protein